MKLYEDTRQKPDAHRVKNLWWRRHGVEVVRRKLDFGDYVDASGRSNVSVDTKQGISELAMDVGRDHDRFVREFERARAAGFRLVVLVEEGARYNDRALMDGWVPVPCRRCGRCGRSPGERCLKYRSRPVQGRSVRRSIATMERDHGVRFEFCDRKDTARRVCELLGLEVRENGG